MFDSPARSRPARGAAGILAAAAVLVAVSSIGCGPGEEPIEIYRIEKRPRPTAPAASSPARPAPVPTRLLGAVILRGAQAWFFKLTGPPDRVAAVDAEFRALVQSIRFEEDQPAWTLPQGWTARPGSQFRHATLFSGGDPPLETSVTVLPKGEDDSSYLLANVNRWRDQLGLAALTPDQLASATEKVDLAEGQALLTAFTGQAAGTAAAAPFAPPAAAPPAARARPPRLEYTAPESWQAAENDAFSQIALTVSRDGQSARATVTVLPRAAVPLADHVNRWRGQVQLPAATPEEIQHSLQKLAVAGISAEASYWQLVGSSETILAAALDNESWQVFVKFKGPNALIEGERARFESFVASLRSSDPQ